MTLLHNGRNVKNSLVGCYENSLPTCTLCNYSKVVIRNVIEQDDKLLIGCQQKLKQNKKRYDLKSISHTKMELKMPSKKGFANKPNPQQAKGGKLNTHSHFSRKNPENPLIFSRHCIVKLISVLIHSDNFSL